MKRVRAATRALLLGLTLLGLTPGHVLAETIDPNTVATVKAAALDGGIRLDWRIADGYYLFANKFRFETATRSATLGAPRLPAAESHKDPFFGTVEVYRGDVSIEIPLTGLDDGTPSVLLRALGQGCKVDGDCFPVRYRITVDAAGITPGGPASSPSADNKPLLSSLLAGGSSEVGGDAGEFLDPDVAFVLQSDIDDSGRLHVRWTVAEGYYLYKDKFGFTAIDPDGPTLGAVSLPAGEMKNDPSFGTIAVFHDSVTATLPVVRTSAEQKFVVVQVAYQGCAEAGLCYPPIKKDLNVLLPASLPVTTGTARRVMAAPSVPAPSGDIPNGELAEQDQLALSLMSGNRWLVLLTFFGLGLLLTFTPCVLPMIPILSSIIVKQGSDLSTTRAFLLSLTYVLAMAATYTVAGVIAGLFGANLQATFQNPWVLGSFALVFVALSLSMFGFYELQIPTSLQSRLGELSQRQRGGTHVGVAVMGALSALIVGPCVAAPLAGALIYIGKTGDAVLGGLALFSLSLGMGAPLLIVGTSAGRLLPRAGPWMNTVKAVFGVMLLAVAIYLIEWFLPIWLSLMLWAAFLIICAIYMGALDALDASASGWRRLFKGTGLVVLVYGVLLMVGASTGSGSLTRPLEGFSVAGGATEESHLTFSRVKDLPSLRAEIARASANSQPVMFDFYADWCVSCKEMEAFTFSDPSVQAALAGARLLQVDVTANNDDDTALLKAFGLFGPPAILFFSADGRELRQYRVVGYMEAEKFRTLVEKAVTQSRRAI